MHTDFFRLDILTPVHIGTGENLDPMSYLMREEGSGASCHILDSQSWAADYPDPDELCAKFSGGNIPQMRKFMADNLDPDIYAIRRIAVNNAAIFQEYCTKRDDQRTSNQLFISPQMSSNGRTPILPGSSLKGALRTAIIDWLDTQQKLELKSDLRTYDDKLKRVLGPITENAFKQLKIADVSGWADSTVLVEARELSRKTGKNATPKAKCEVLPGQLQAQAHSAPLFGKLALGEMSRPASRRLTLPDGTSWSWEELADLLHDYVAPRLDEEIAKFYRQPHFAKTLPVALQLRQALTDRKPGQMFLRVGHYSHIEFVTVRNNRPLTRKGKDGNYLPHGTTRTLADGVFPFGWVRLTPCSEAEYREGLKHCQDSHQQVQVKRQALRSQIFVEKDRQAAERRTREQELKAAQLAEEQRLAEEEARRATLSPLERSILEVIEADPDPNKSAGAKLFTALKQGRWQDQDARVVAQRVKEDMVLDGKWKEVSTKKNPAKDHDYQKTLEVLKYLRVENPS